MMTRDSSELAAASLSVRFWGVRGSIPSPGPETAGYGGNTSCVELRVGNEVLVLDAGSGIRRLGIALAHELVGNPLTTTLLISHTHWDHIQGLPFFRPAYSRASQIRILGAPGTRTKLRAALTSQMDPIQFPVSIECLAGISAIDEFAAGTTTIGSFVVRTIALNHPGGCTGFRIDAGGTSVAYLPDHEPYRSSTIAFDSVVAAATGQAETEFLDFLEGCNLLILDSQYDRSEYPGHVGWGHGCLEDSVALALRAGVRSLVLFHHDPDHDDQKIDSMVQQARQQVADAGSRLQVHAAREQEQLVPRARHQLAA
ncbi:MAG TPA: MBL fold metallo-hydrolase [Chthoniobacterales bacterium]|nr:MBL fold metallo-hydrolase [Chthoniobacterales bacterium]